MPRTHFRGAKLMLFCGDQLLVYLRDEKPGLAFAGHWDLPGGGREGDESPETCVLRETFEEFGLRLSPEDLRFAQTQMGFTQPPMLNWYFVAHMPAALSDEIKFGDEGQYWQLMTPAEFIAHPLGIPHLQTIVAEYLAQLKGTARASGN
ncbi:MAG: NUDIX hydrolase [Mangrovicoccus sp.]